MAVRLLRHKVPFEDRQIENLEAEMFQMGNGLWFSREMIFDDASWFAFHETGDAWLEEHGCFSVDRLLEIFCDLFRHSDSRRIAHCF